MNRRFQFRIVFAAVALLAIATLSGCAGFWDALPSSSSSSGDGTNPGSGVFYVLNQKTSQVAGFTFASGATSPTAVSGSPYALPTAGAYTIAIAPSGNYLYVSTEAGIYFFIINSDGSLSAGESGSLISSDPAYAMQVDPSGGWLFEAASGNGVLSAIPLDPSTGAPLANATTQTVSLPTTGTIMQIAVSPSGSSNPYVFVALATGGTAIFSFNSSSSTPLSTSYSLIKTKNQYGGDNTVAVDPQNRLLYVGESNVFSSVTQTAGLRVFTIGSGGALSEISGSPFTIDGTGPSSIVATSSSVYVANSAVGGSSVGNITGFTVAASGSTYTLTSVGTIAAGSQTKALAIDSSSSYLLAVNYGGSPDLSTFTFDTTTTGKLDAGPTAATGTDPVGASAIAAVP